MSPPPQSGLQYLEKASRWPSAAHVPPHAGWASSGPPGTSPVAPTAPECGPLYKIQHIITVCASVDNQLYSTSEKKALWGMLPSLLLINISLWLLESSLVRILSVSHVITRHYKLGNFLRLELCIEPQTKCFVRWIFLVIDSIIFKSKIFFLFLHFLHFYLGNGLTFDNLNKTLMHFKDLVWKSLVKKKTYGKEKKTK